MLVTSHKQGYAMKAAMDKVKTGQVIGKALQEFDGEEGKIKVYPAVLPFRRAPNIKRQTAPKELFAKYIELPLQAITRF